MQENRTAYKREKDGKRKGVQDEYRKRRETSGKREGGKDKNLFKIKRLA